MVVKDNQPILRADLVTLFARPPGPAQDLRGVQQVNKGRGRIEVRTLLASVDLNDYLDWPGLAQSLCLERKVHYLKSGQTTLERVYGLTSLAPDQLDLHKLLIRWRGHWGIENKLHWVRDVQMGEDACRVRTASAPQALAAFRNSTISLVKLLGYPSVKNARRRFALDLHHALMVVCGSLE
jgi:hypothetical protein